MSFSDHMRPDGKPCAYAADGVVCTKCGQTFGLKPVSHQFPATAAIAGGGAFPDGTPVSFHFDGPNGAVMRIGPPALPSKSKCLKMLRRIFPGAHFCGFTADGKRHLELRYGPNAAPVAQVSVPAGGLESALPWAIVKAVCTRFGYTATWENGEFDFKAIEGFVGPESMLPVELDPDTQEESKPA